MLDSEIILSKVSLKKKKKKKHKIRIFNKSMELIEDRKTIYVHASYNHRD